MKLLSVGVRRRPSTALPSFSSAKERERPRTPANVNVIQSIAGAASFMRPVEKAKAKLNMTTTRMEKVSIDVKSSFVLISVIRSFFTIAQILCKRSFLTLYLFTYLYVFTALYLVSPQTGPSGPISFRT